MPNARLLPLEGEAHFPCVGDSDAILGAILDFLGEPAPDAAPPTLHAVAVPPADGLPNGATGLTQRETQVLRLLAAG